MQGRIVRLLLEVYPITIDDIIKDLGLSRSIVEREINKLVARGVVDLDVLPDKQYIRLQRRDFSFIGLRESQKTALKRKRPKKPKEKDYDGLMYG